MNHLNSVALHITNICSHNCPMCYATNQTQTKRESDLDNLKKIAIELKKANVCEINLVGGDPCEYSHIEELLKYLNSLGFSLPILSNTPLIRTFSLGISKPVNFKEELPALIDNIIIKTPLSS